MGTIASLVVKLGVDLSDLRRAPAESRMLGQAAGEAAGSGFERGFRRRTGVLGRDVAAGVGRDSAWSASGQQGGSLLRTALMGAVAGAGRAIGDSLMSKILNRKQEIKVTIDQAALVRDIRTAVEVAEHTTKLHLDAEPKTSKLELANFAVGAAGLGIAALTSFGGSASSAAAGGASLTGVIMALAAAMAAMGAAASIGVASISVLGGVLGSIPALAMGAAGGIGALLIGFTGIAGAFQKTASAGSSATVSVDRVARAERTLAAAQREVLRAQQDINTAIAEEVESREDLDRSLRRAQHNQRQAAQDLVDARQEIADARASGDVTAVRRAQLAYQDAALAVEETRDATEDLAAQQEVNATTTVQQSQRVQDAYNRQQQAIDNLTSAQEELRSAQTPTGGGGGIAQEVTRLAPAAAAAVAAIKGLRGVWEDLRLSVQQRLFAGVAGEIQALAKAWLPTLKTQLGGFATSINTLFKTMSGTVRQPDFITNMAAGMDAARAAFDRIGAALGGPFLAAMGKLSKAAAPFIEALGQGVAGLLEKIAGWITKASDSGGLDSFFQTATGFFTDVKAMGKDVASIIGSIVSAMFGGEETAQAEGVSGWDQLKETLNTIAGWFKDPENAKLVSDFFAVLSAAAMWAVWAVEKIGDAINWVIETVDAMVGWFDKLPGRLGSLGSSMWRGIVNGAKSAVNAIIRAWNALDLSINIGIPDWVPAPLGGRRWHMADVIPDIPLLARGGTTITGGAAIVGDGGEPEVVDLPAGARVTPTGGLPQAIAAAIAAALGSRGESGDLIVSVDGEVIERRALAAVRRNPTTVAKAAKAGNRTLAYTG